MVTFFVFLVTKLFTKAGVDLCLVLWLSVLALKIPPGGNTHDDRSAKVKIVCNSGTVNIRVGNGTDYGRITAVADGTVFEHVATAANGWHTVKVGSQIGWVSGKYSEITTA